MQLASASLTSSGLAFVWVPFALCNAWQRSRTQNLRRVSENSDPIVTRLWTEVHEILERCREPLVLSNAFARLSISLFIQKIFAIKSRSRRKIKQVSKFVGPHFWERRPRRFYGKLLARYTVHRLAKFGWVPFAGLRLRSLATN